MIKNDRITLTITAIANDGNGIGRHSSGIAVFVPFSAIGDELDVQIVKVAKNYAFGIIKEIITPSPHRIKPDCEAFGKCGGCNFRHITYEEELRQKAGFVTDAFMRIGKFSRAELTGGGSNADNTDNSENADTGGETVKIHGGAEINRYRNKAQVPFQNGEFGYFAARSHRIVPCSDCKLQTTEMNDIIERAAEILRPAGDTVRNIYIRRGNVSGEIMLCIVAKNNIEEYIRAELIQYVKSTEHIKSFILNINPEDTNVILGKKNITLWGQASITDKISGIEVDLYPNAFYQVNTPQAEKLYNIAADYAALTENDNVLELYCGMGALTCLLARKAKKVYGAEIVGEAITSAKKNAARAGVQNIFFFTGDTKGVTEWISLERTKTSIPIERRTFMDVIVTDPPRKGHDESTLSNMLAINPKRIVMISCDPATAARDARRLCDGGYTLRKIEAVDMFPRTANVECVLLLER
jgi:23S rRNA (uracil1939-C5)-methyltransferase